MRYVKPDELHSVWAFVKAGLEVVRNRCFERWIPEDVYTALKQGGSQLFVAEDGFIVVTPQKDQFSGEQILFIWAAYGTNALVYEEGEKLITQLAKQIGAKRIQMESPRRGWERRGFDPVKIVYERIV